MAAVGAWLLRRRSRKPAGQLGARTLSRVGHLKAVTTGSTVAPAFDLDSYLKGMKQRVEVELERSVSSECAHDERLTSAMRHSLLAGGKRVRPIMCIAACALARKCAGKDVLPGVEPDEDTLRIAMPTAIALEMLHTMSLIHDDLPSLDDDSVRRGKPTCHVKYGEGAAIVAGDSLLVQAFYVVARDTPQTGSCAVPGDRVIEVIRRLADGIGPRGMAVGEAMDLAYEDREATLDELRWMHEHKTGAVLESAVTTGAILGGMDLESDVPALERYANAMGLAFQIQDDILDITGTTEDLGKTAGKDLHQRKATYPRLMGLEGARNEAQRLYEEAVGALRPFEEHSLALESIANYIVKRCH